jgi:hypothetical protein
MLALDGVLGRCDPARSRIDLRRERLCEVVKQCGEDPPRLFMGRQRRPFGKPWKLGADHLRVGPDIAFRMPPTILLTIGHRSTPGLIVGPGYDFVKRCL